MRRRQKSQKSILFVSLLLSLSFFIHESSVECKCEAAVAAVVAAAAALLCAQGSTLTADASLLEYPCHGALFWTIKIAWSEA